jgi:hypothetical protein
LDDFREEQKTQKESIANFIVELIVIHLDSFVYCTVFEENSTAENYHV